MALAANFNPATAGELKEVVIHPLVLLSVVDHYNRVAKDTKKRVVGVLLGEVHKGKVDVTNSYAVPFEEDLRDKSIWYLDHNYHENMYAMFKKVAAKEKIVGWYSTGPKIRPPDIEINELLRGYTSNPVFAIIDVNPKDNIEVPLQAYISKETPPEAQVQHKRSFVHLASSIGAYEAEEVGVEHLLRDLRDTSVTTIGDKVTQKVQALHGLKKRMIEMHAYLENVTSGKIPPNHQVIYNLQDIFNLLPDLRVKELVKSITVSTNDNMLVIYLSSLIRSILALHNLINNKLFNRDWEKKKAAEASAEKEKEANKGKKTQKTDKDKEGEKGGEGTKEEKTEKK